MQDESQHRRNRTGRGIPRSEGRIRETLKQASPSRRAASLFCCDIYRNECRDTEQAPATVQVDMNLPAAGGPVAEDLPAPRQQEEK
jgi:hypothetical protein